MSIYVVLNPFSIQIHSRFNLRVIDHARSRERRFMRSLRESAHIKPRQISDVLGSVTIGDITIAYTHGVECQEPACSDSDLQQQDGRNLCRDSDVGATDSPRSCKIPIDLFSSKKSVRIDEDNRMPGIRKVRGPIVPSANP